jgi:2-polyprenyl-3-methyl-5-hydroxy-6-metoxy-1,4-benzoquinol methylase
MTVCSRLNIYNHIMGLVPEFDGLTRRLVAILESLSSTTRVLEVGSGTGLLTQALSTMPDLRELACVDPDEEACRMLAQFEWAKRGKIASIVPRSLEKCELKGGFDAIVNRFVIHHIPDERKCLVLRTMRRFLRRGGTLVIGDMVLPHYDIEANRLAAVEKYYRSTLQIAHQIGDELLIADQQECYRRDLNQDGEYKTCRCRTEREIKEAGFRGLRRFRVSQQGKIGWPGILCVTATKA